MPASILCRAFWRMPVRLSTPLVLLDADDGRIPGTALAGALRAALAQSAHAALTVPLFDGRASDRRGSRLTVSDILLDDPEIISAPDGTSTIAAGASGMLRLSAVICQNDPIAPSQAIAAVREMLALTASGAVSLGARKSRGAGQLTAAGSAEERVFDYALPEIGKAYLAFLKAETYAPILLPPPSETSVLVLRADLVQRTPYAGTAPCIPGTVWSRAIRLHAAAILRELGMADRIPEMEALWGDRQHASAIRFTDTPLVGAVDGQSVRLSLDPLTGAAGRLDHILTWTGGRTSLTLTVRGCEGWMAGVLLLVLRDLTEGYLAVGAQTAVGCGMFTGSVTAPQDALTALKEACTHDARTASAP